MTVQDFISLFPKESNDNGLAIIGPGDDVLCDATFDDYTNLGNITFSCESITLRSTLNAIKYVHSFMSLLDFEIEPGTVKLLSIRVEDVEQTYVPDVKLLLRNRKKFVQTYGVMLKGIGTVQQLNYAVYCKQSNKPYNSEDIGWLQDNLNRSYYYRKSTQI